MCCQVPKKCPEVHSLIYQVSASSWAGGFMFSTEPSALDVTENAETQEKSTLLRLIGFVLTSLTFLLPL